MRVAYLVNQYPKISHSFIRREILALERRGLEIIRISLRGWDLELVDPDDLSERGRTRFVLQGGLLALLPAIARMLFGYPVYFFRALSVAWRMSRGSNRPIFVHLGYFAEACRVLGWLREEKVEHVHAHFGTNSAEVAMLVNELGGPRWSFTVHGSELIDNPEAIGLSEKVRHCTFVVAISSFGRAQLYRLVEIHHWPKIQLIRCGLEPDFYSATATPISPNRRLVCVGRLSAEKGQLLLVQAAARLAACGMKFELVLAGDGPLRDDIQQYVAGHNLHAHVRLAGWISNDLVRHEILASRALVLPSFMEGLPVVIMEGMALRRPVIATCVGGIPELVSSGEHGWLVPPGDVDALADTMRDCLETPSEVLERFGEAAYRKVIAHHNVDTEAAKLAKLFAI